MGKLIVIEGLDGSGKSTQLELLPQNLLKQGIESRMVSFPDYDSNSSALVKMYLAGEFGKKPGDVNAYAASLFYAVDRFASYKTNWGEYYNQNGVIVSGRYTTSNAVHQTSKMDESDWQGFLDWLYDLEYNKVGIPKPDKVIFLNVPVEVSQGLLSDRYAGDESKKDIHERDKDYLLHCHKAADFAINQYGWDKIECYDNDKMRSREDISKEVLKIVLPLLK